jgi:thiamine biosynthesis protein ThiI
MMDVAVVGFGEIGTKSRAVRERMTARLRDNLAALLDARGVDATVERRWSRLLVHADDADGAARVAGDAMGVVRAWPATRADADPDAACDALARLAAAVDAGPEDTYAVRATRTGDHGFTGRELERAGGRAVGDVTAASVDLDDPDRTYHVEVRDETAYVAATSYEGPGGLPLGTQAPLVALLSGGHDSPVAAYEAMRRGSPVYPVYVSLGDYGGPDHEARAMDAAATLSSYAPNFDTDLRVVPGGDLAATLVDEVGDTRMLSWRRALLAAGERVAEHEGAAGVVTGESVGQKSSQTATNLAVTDAAVDLPVHRPLLTADKADIVERARAIGTHESSSVPVGCERLDPPVPETRASLDAVEAVEPDDLLARAAAAADDARAQRL